MRNYNEKRERMKFVRTWAEYIKRTPNSIWSKQYVMFINSLMKSALQDKEIYFKTHKINNKN